MAGSVAMQRMNLSTELDAEHTETTKGILDIATRIARRIRSMTRSTKMKRIDEGEYTATLQALEAEAALTGDNTELNKYKQNILNQNYIHELKDLQKKLVTYNDKVGFKEYFLYSVKMINKIDEALRTSGAVDLKVLSEYFSKMRFYSSMQDVIDLIEEHR